MQKGSKMPQSVRLKISRAHIRSGHKPPTRKGFKLSEKTRQRMSEAALRKFARGYVVWMKGKKHTKQANAKNRAAHIGIESWNKGKKMPSSSKKKVSSSIARLWKNPEYRKLMSEAHIGQEAWNKGKFGPQSHMWLGGISFEPYSVEFTKRLKYKVRLRDNFTCLGCGMTEKEQKKRINYVLSVHHIDYDKKNCKMSNLATTCIGCNIKANYRRKDWTKFYRSIIRSRNEQAR